VFSCRFIVLRGLVNVFLQEEFLHVNAFFFPRLKIDTNMGFLPYSIIAYIQKVAGYYAEQV